MSMHEWPGPCNKEEATGTSLHLVHQEVAQDGDSGLRQEEEMLVSM